MRQRIPKREALTVDRERTVLRDGQFVTEVLAETIMLDGFDEGDVSCLVPGGYQRRREYMAAAPSEDASPEENCALAVNMGNLPWWEFRAPAIYFATNRRVDPIAPVKERFTAIEANHLTFGTVRVNLPCKENHSSGSLEVPKHFWNRLDPEKHFFLEETSNILTEQDLLNVMISSIEVQENDLLVFIHGFDNTFEDAALRVSQLRLDSHFPGQVLLLSWASLGKSGLGSYGQDEERSARSIPLFAKLLRKLALDRSRLANPGDIHLVAHSMGNRVLLGVLKALAADPTLAGTQPFGHIIFAAADEEGTTFQLQVQHASQLSRSRTLYYCMEDKALRVSQEFHNNINRAGQAMIPVLGLDNIDSANASTSFLSHDYFVSTNPLLSDIELLLNFDRRPGDRPPLEERIKETYKEWKFP